MAKRLVAMGSPRYRNGFTVTLQEDLVDLPRRWRKPKTIFVNSMSDLFHANVPSEFIARVFRTMAECPQHNFQILTKRAERLVELAPHLPWTPNVWMGVSIESQKYAFRATLLRDVPARIRFLSVEPMPGAIHALPLQNIHWVIVGGESGRGARPLERQWVGRERRGRHSQYYLGLWYARQRRSCRLWCVQGRRHQSDPGNGG